MYVMPDALTFDATAYFQELNRIESHTFHANSMLAWQAYVEFLARHLAVIAGMDDVPMLDDLLSRIEAATTSIRRAVGLESE